MLGARFTLILLFVALASNYSERKIPIFSPSPPLSSAFFLLTLTMNHDTFKSFKDLVNTAWMNSKTP